MWTILLYVGFAVFGMAGAAMLGLSLSRRIQRNKGARAAAMMMLAFMGMFTYIPPETAKISEPSEEMKVKKGSNSGGPPDPD